MDAVGAVVLIAGLSWLARVPLAESALRNADQSRHLPAEQREARSQFLEWLATLPGWPGGALLSIGGFMIWL